MSEEQTTQTSEMPQHETEIQNEAAQSQPEGSFDLTVQDLSAIKTIIDAAAQRGAFKPAEMEVVGKTYNKLAGFLASVTKGAQNG
jgi:uncharacterized protein YccT (UPF0319 family)